MANLLQNTALWFKNIKNLVITVLVCVVGYLFLIPDREPEIIEVPVEVRVEVPRIINKIDTVEIPKPSIIRVPNPINDSLLAQYNQAKDSLDRLEIFLDAITEREYDVEFIDSTQQIVVHSEVRGTLLDQDVDYEIFPRSVTVVDTIDVEIKPRTKVFGLAKVGLPALGDMTLRPTFEAGFAIVNKKDRLMSLTLDTQGRVMIGYGIKF